MISVVGGCYHEVCLSPPVRQFYGSGGRAAAALASAGLPVTLETFASPGAERHARRLAALSNLQLALHPTTEEITFAYVSPVHSPEINPLPVAGYADQPLMSISGDLVLQFGMVEGGAKVEARTVVYDPQSSWRPRSFQSTGSTADRVAILCNLREARALANVPDPALGRAILDAEGASVVIIKKGPAGASVVTPSGESAVPAFYSDTVFSIGSGDIFAAAFTHSWGHLNMSPHEAAVWSSQAAAHYVRTRLERFPTDQERSILKPTTLVSGRVYLAGPFFTMAQRWLIEQTRAVLLSMGLEVFSPLHDVGFGDANKVATADLLGLSTCDRVLSIVDGLDAGTVFELGYARRMGIPVIAYTELVDSENCKMIEGSGCRVVRDYATSIYLTAWRAS